jgi:hypothetical protein
MPVSSTMGSDSGSAPRSRICGYSRRGTGSSRGMLRWVAMICTATISTAAIKSPGSTPPRNSAPTEVPETSA